MLSKLIKALIEKKLQIPYDRISEKSSEQLDEHIEKTIIHKKLNIAETNAGIVMKRGYVLDLVSIGDINIEIDNFVRTK